MVVLIQIRESGKAVSGDPFGLATAIHFRVNSQGAAAHGDDFALEGDDVARENRELEVDAVEHQKDGILRVNILRHSEIGTFQEILGTTTCKESLMVVEVGEFDESLGISCFRF